MLICFGKSMLNCPIFHTKQHALLEKKILWLLQGKLHRIAILVIQWKMFKVSKTRSLLLGEFWPEHWILWGNDEKVRLTRVIANLCIIFRCIYFHPLWVCKSSELRVTYSETRKINIWADILGNVLNGPTFFESNPGSIAPPKHLHQVFNYMVDDCLNGSELINIHRDIPLDTDTVFNR